MHLSVIREYFTPSSILDVGANTGWFYNLATQQFPDAYYYLIEANPLCEDVLKSLNVDYYIGPISDSIKTVAFYTSKSDPLTTGASIYKENTSHFSDDNLITNYYQTTLLDSLLNDKYFDLIKMDVQGSELDIIRGGLSIIKNAKGLLLELSCLPYNEGAPLEQEIIAYLQTIGFYEEEELDCHYTPNHELFQRDVLFINKNL